MNIEKLENEIEKLLKEISILESKYIGGENYLLILKKYLKYRIVFFNDYKGETKDD